MKKISFLVNLPVSILREEKKFIAYTPVLDLSTSGKSHNEARRRFGEVVQIFFEELIRMGTLEEVLRDLGWKKVHAKWMPPIVVAHESQNVHVPVHA